MNKKMISTYSKVIAVICVVLFLGFVVSEIVKDYKKLMGSKNEALMTKKYDPVIGLINFRDNVQPRDEAHMRNFMRYYNRIIVRFPKRSDAYGMLGYCSFHLNKIDEAIDYYKKAIEINPDFFWFNYNLGILYFKKSEYKQAVGYLMNTVRNDPNPSLDFISGSRDIYWVVLSKTIKDSKDIINQMRLGHEKVFILAILSNYYLKNYQEMLQVSRVALERKVGSPGQFNYYAGLALYEEKQFTKAIYFFQEALKDIPNLAQAYKYLALTFKALGNGAASDKLTKTYENMINSGNVFELNEDKITLEIY